MHLQKPIDPPLHTKVVDNNIFDALSIFNARKSIPIIPNLQEPTIDLHTPFYLDLNDKSLQIKANKISLANFKGHSHLCTIFLQPVIMSNFDTWLFITFDQDLYHLRGEIF